MRGHRIFFFLLFISACLVPALAQTAAGKGTIPATGGVTGFSSTGSASSSFFEELTQVPEGRALLAMTASDYPVTPGDIYTLSFLKGTDIASQSLVVENDYRVNMAVFGMLNARGQSFIEFKRRVEETVSKGYPGSSPQLIIRSTGIFEVQVLGEVANTGLNQSWGLQRLSSLYSAYRTAYSSERQVGIRSANGSERYYDLYKARRTGDLSQDPYLRPGDRVVISNAERRVSISGQVIMPGQYQLLPGEDLTALVLQYAKGFTDLADSSRMQITRLVSEDSSVGKLIYVDASKNNGMSELLRDLDAVIVSSNQDFLPVVWFEGAIGIGKPVSGEAADIPDVSNRVPYAFHPGSKLSTAVFTLRNQFSAISDIKNAYLRRVADGEIIPVNLENFLHRFDFSEDVILQANDVIIIPFRQFFVTVSGSVYNPGRYPYVPDRSWAYYVSLAGGVNQELNNGRRQFVYDIEGKPRSIMEYIQPEDRIMIPANSFLYSFGRVASILTTTISVASLALGILQFTR